MSDETKESTVNTEIMEISREFLPTAAETLNLMDWITILSKAEYYEPMGIPGMVAIILTGRELGIGPMASLNGALWNVLGRIVMSAEQMRAKFREAGHSLTIVSLNDELCTLKGIRKDNNDSLEYTFTMGDAKRAGSAGKNNWLKDPKSMLVASCSKKLIRFLAPELLCGVSIDGDEDEQTEIEVVPEELLDKETQDFIKKFDLLNEQSPGFDFIKIVSKGTRDSSIQTIKNCAKDSDKFEKALDKFIKETQTSKVEK